MERAETYGNAEDANEVYLLSREFEKRIDQLSQYYEQHSTDENISIFHMLKLKMQRTLFLA